MIERGDYDGIAILTLAHGKANTMDIEFCQALIEAIHQLRSSSAKAVVLTGRGKIFSAGVDLLRASEGGSTYMRKFLPVLNAMFDAVFHFPRPVVVAINGHAIAGGCVLACCGDMRFMAKGESRIGVTELLVGLPFPALAFEIMRLATAPRFFPRAIYAGETWLCEEGVRRGWVDEIVAQDELIERAVAAAQRLAALPQNSFAITKRQMHAPAIERMEREGEEIDAVVTEIWSGPDAATRIRDYVARTFKKR